MRWVLPIALILAGLGSSLICYYNIKQGMATTSWPAVQGRLVDSNVKMKHSCSSAKKCYYVTMRYEYELGATVYDNDVISYSANLVADTFDEAEELLTPYRAADHLTVHYNPEDPNESVLIPGFSFWDLLWIAAGIGMLIGGLVFLIKPSLLEHKMTITPKN